MEFSENLILNLPEELLNNLADGEIHEEKNPVIAV